ncbi:MAG: glycosyltransferase [Armatimonadota bacterium]|nr:glycosyltransferase [Armatimonadota bacterium]
MKRTVFQVIYSLTTGGAERLVVNLCLHLNRERFQPVCISLREPQNTHYEHTLQKAGIPLYFLNKIEGKADWQVYKRLDALFWEYRPSVVHTHLLGLNYAFLLMLKHRTPVRVHTVHSVAQRERGVRVGKMIRTLAFRHRIGSVLPVAVADEVARTIEQVYGYKNPLVIRNGIPIDAYAPDPDKRAHFRRAHGAESDALVLVHIGRFVELKNHALLLRAFAQLQSEHPLYLWLIGDGELRPQMEQLAQELGIAARVRFWGIRPDVPDILNAADIFTLPSKYEGNPLSVMEAMAAGLPVIATAVGGVPELVDDGQTGILVPEDSETHLVRALQTLIDNPTLRQQMGQAALLHAQKRFDIRNTVKQYEELYDAILLRHLPFRERADPEANHESIRHLGGSFW